MEVLRATETWQQAGAYYVRIQAMAKKHHITLREEFDEHDGPDTRYIVLLDDDFPVATARMYPLPDRRMVIGRVVVLPEYRHRGLGTQVVAGTNHLFLCKTAPVVPGAAETYALVTVYEDLKGNASVTDVQNCEAKAPAAPDDGSMVAGGVTEAQTPEVTPDAKAALDKACQGLDGAKYEVKALLGTQVVAGTNYTLLCKITPVVPNASSHYAIVKVYEKPDGSAEISETFDFTPSNNA